MPDDEDADLADVPEGAAVFPEIPAELGIHPLLLGVIHATVFLAGSEEAIVNADASDEAVQQIARYLQRLEGPQQKQVQEDMVCLISFARQEKWERGLIQALRTFLSDLGVTTENEA